MKTAIVGLGVIGHVHYDVLKNMGAEIVALCDVDLSKIENFDGCNKYENYLEMLEKECLDVVHICTPHYLHADMIIEALERGVNVLCEKPLCIKEEDIERILEAENKSSAILGVCHQNRYNAENKFVKEYIKDKNVKGALGNMVWQRTEEYYRSGDWRGKWQTEGGGVLINQALHTLDLLIWFVGEPDSVSSSITNHRLKGVIEVEDTANIIASGKSNFTFFGTNSSSVNFPVYITIAADDEYILVYSPKVIVGDKEYNFEKDKRIYGKCCYGNGHDGLIKEFYDSIKKGEKFWIDGKEASKVIKLILSVYKQNNLKGEENQCK